MSGLLVEHGSEPGATAVFSLDLRLRYRLRRRIAEGGSRRVVFVMLNPSTADAFKLDPTVSKCAEFARRWGMHELEVVNLFAYRTSKPAELRLAIKASGEFYETGYYATILEAMNAFGAGPLNDAQILEAVHGAARVVAAWGNHGEDLNFFAQHMPHARGEYVRKMIQRAVRKMIQRAGATDLYHFGTTGCGAPLHPLARGKSWIPYDREPVVWT